jgi:ABC-2 type transport system permease protein
MLGAIAALIGKDLRLLARDRGGLFLTFAWPLVLAIFFGALGPGFGTQTGGGDAAMTVLIVDEARTHTSAALLAELEGHPRLTLAPAELDDAREQVRLGEAPAYVRVQASAVELGVDPRRHSEGEVLEAALELAAWRSLSGETTPIEIHREPVELAPAKLGSAARPPNPYAVTFPQGILWAVLACAATFAVSLVDERSQGTLLRLAVAPVSRFAILAGKAGACLIAIVIMQIVLVAVAVLGFGVRPHSWGLLALALAATALCFVGIMTLLAVLGRRTRSAAGLSWAVLMSMAMLGGGMLPLFMMPSWLQIVATASPVAWALTAIEGAIWRGFSAAELALPCAGLLTLGAVCLVIGSRSVREL